MPQFYLATDKDGYRHLLTVATEATKMDPNMKPLEIGSDKSSIQTAIQELLREADTLKHIINGQHKADEAEDAPTEPTGLHLNPAPYRKQDVYDPAPVLPDTMAPAYTRSLIDAMFSPRDQQTRELCSIISKLDGIAFAHVAFEVAAKIAGPFVKKESTNG